MCYKHASIRVLALARICVGRQVLRVCKPPLLGGFSSLFAGSLRFFRYAADAMEGMRGGACALHLSIYYFRYAATSVRLEIVAGTSNWKPASSMGNNIIKPQYPSLEHASNAAF